MRRRSAVALVVVDVLARVLVVGRVGLSDDGVRSTGSSVWLGLVRAVPLQQGREVGLVPPQPGLDRRTAGPQTVAPHHTPRPPSTHQGSLPAPHDRLHLPDVDGGDGAGVHHRLGSVGGGGPGFMTHQAGPLFGKTNELVIGGVKTCVHSMLEVCWGRYLRLFLLLCKHVVWVK